MACGYYFSMQAYRVYMFFFIVVKCGIDLAISYLTYRNEYLITILTFNIFTYALMIWCHWTPDMDSLALGTRTGGYRHLCRDPNPPLPIRI